MNLVELKNQLIQIEDKIDDILSYRTFEIEGNKYKTYKVDIYNNEILLESLDSNKELLITFENIASYL